MRKLEEWELTDEKIEEEYIDALTRDWARQTFVEVSKGKWANELYEIADCIIDEVARVAVGRSKID